MDAPGRRDPRWAEDLAWLASTRYAKVRNVLEKSEAAQRRSAALLRAVGREDLALSADRRAAWIRFDLDEPKASRQLYAMTRGLRRATRPGALSAGILHGALALTGAIRGNVQILVPGTGALRIVEQQGFDSEFLEYFATVRADGSACGRAASQRAQVVIADVTADPAFAAHLDIAASSGFRAVQSTPLIDRSGLLVGMVSTHFSQAQPPPDRDLLFVRRFGDLAGEALASLLRQFDPGEALPGSPASPLDLRARAALADLSPDGHVKEPDISASESGKG